METFQIKHVSDSIFLLVYLEYSYIPSSEWEGMVTEKDNKASSMMLLTRRPRIIYLVHSRVGLQSNLYSTYGTKDNQLQ